MSTLTAATIAQLEAEVAWYEDLLERLQTVPGSWTDWDEALTCGDRQEKSAEECACALADVRDLLQREHDRRAGGWRAA